MSSRHNILTQGADLWQGGGQVGPSFTRVDELLAFLGLEGDRLAGVDRDPAPFGLRVPRTFAQRMRRKDPNDPLLRQVLPLTCERRESPGYGPDPLAEGRAERVPGLLVKYAGRALMLVTGACAIHCRYCFRRHTEYPPLWPHLDRILATLAADSKIHEVILSGGDPLMLSDRRLSGLIKRLAEIPHLKRLRIHTRVPIVWPERLNAQLAAVLLNGRLDPVLVTHVNHPQELDAAVGAALRAWKGRGLTLLNQGVLLRGVNDRVETLVELSERLFACGVLPYYLHALDPVAGSAHFAVTEAEAKRLMADLRARLPGYLVPRLVRESPGAAAKQPLL